MTKIQEKEPDQKQERETHSVALTIDEWQAAVQLLSVGTRHSDDSVLAVGGGLIAEVKRQVEASAKNAPQ